MKNLWVCVAILVSVGCDLAVEEDAAAPPDEVVAASQQEAGIGEMGIPELQALADATGQVIAKQTADIDNILRARALVVADTALSAAQKAATLRSFDDDLARLVAKRGISQAAHDAMFVLIRRVLAGAVLGAACEIVLNPSTLHAAEYRSLAQQRAIRLEDFQRTSQSLARMRAERTQRFGNPPRAVFPDAQRALDTLNAAITATEVELAIRLSALRADIATVVAEDLAKPSDAAGNGLKTHFQNQPVPCTKGCTQPMSTNFNPAANRDSGTCIAAVVRTCRVQAGAYCNGGFDCCGGYRCAAASGRCVLDTTVPPMPIISAVYGCTDLLATNYNPAVNMPGNNAAVCTYARKPPGAPCNAHVECTSGICGAQGFCR